MSDLLLRQYTMQPESWNLQYQRRTRWRRRDIRSWSVFVFGSFDSKADQQASIAESGLGVISWWNQGEQEEEMEEQLEE